MLNKLFGKIVCSLVLVISIVGIFSHAYAGNLGGSPTATASDNIAGNTANYLINMRTSDSGALIANDQIRITFPAGFNITGSGLAGYAGIAGNALYSIEGNTAILTLDAGATVGNNTFVSINLSGVINNQTAATNYHLTIQSTHSGSTVDGPTNTLSFSIMPRAPNQIQSSINPDGNTQVLPGSVTTITITSEDEFGNPTPNQEALWSNDNGNFSLDTTTGTTDSNGQNSVHLTAPLTTEEVTNVTAQIGGVVTHITLTSGDVYVNHGPTTSISITPVGPLNLTSDQSQTFLAQAHDEYGNSWDITADVVWHANDPVGGFVDNTYNAGKVGSWTIYASYNGFESNNVTANITHGAAVLISTTPENVDLTSDQTQQFNAQATDADGNIWDATDEAVWTTTDLAGTVVNGLYSAHNVGDWEVRASLNGQEDSSCVHVSHGIATSINITPANSINLNADQSQTFLASAADADGNTWDITGDVVWHENDPWGSFTDNTYSAGQVGAWTIYATLDVLTSNSVTANISHGEVDHVIITPINQHLANSGDTQIYTLAAYDIDGNVWDVTTQAVFTTTDPNGNFVDNIYTGGKIGTWDINASYDGHTNTTNVFVDNHGVATSLTIDPVGPIDMTADDHEDFFVTAHDNYGNSWDVTNDATYHENDPWGSFTNNTYSAGQVGAWTIYASIEAVNSNNVTVNVSVGVLHHVNITPDTTQNITAGDTVQFSAQGYDSDGNPISELIYNWNNATVSGLFNTTTAGAYTVFATANGVHSAEVTVNVDHNVTTNVVINPNDTQNILAGGHIDFTATAFDAYGNETGDVITWTGTSAADCGLFNNTTMGTYTVYATANGIPSAHITVNVDHNVTANVAITPNDTQNIIAGDHVDFTATAYDAYGNATGDAITWTGTSAADSGLFNTTTAGTYTVFATANGVHSAEVTVNVAPSDLHHINITPNVTQTITAGETVQFSAQGFDAYGNIIEGLTYTWTNATATGLFNNTTAGTYAVQAHLDAIDSNLVNVTVLPGELHHINITPNTDQTIAAGDTVTFTATAYDQYNNAISGLVLSWDNAENGVFNNTSKGAYTVYAYVGAIESNHVSVTVNPGALYRVTISAATTRHLTAGETYTFTVQSYDRFGNSLTGQTYTWTGTLTGTGLFNTTTAGTYYVQAHNSGIDSNIVMVVVSPSTVNHIVITPNNTQTITAGATLSFSALAYDVYNNVVSDQTISWSGATNGVFNNTVSGAYTVYAYIGAIESTHVTVNVNAGALHHINITPNVTQTITAGETVQFSAQGFDAYGNAIAGLVFGWNNTDATGLFTNSTPGTYTVQTHVDAITSNTVNVSVIPVVGGFFSTESLGSNTQDPTPTVNTILPDYNKETVSTVSANPLESIRNNKNDFLIILLVILGAAMLYYGYSLNSKKDNSSLHSHL